jgi:hypothetical protein
MRKYFTWRCIALHVTALVLVPAFLLAGWWQYHVALGGNDLGWVYTVEWPFFAGYAVYMWWALIHDQRTPFDRLWAAKQRAAADASGRPLHQIPGWAMDKTLSRAVVEASMEAARDRELAAGTPAVGPRIGMLAPGQDLPAAASPAAASPDAASPAAASPAASPAAASRVIDARVVDVKVVVDEELDAYNRYLTDLSWRDPPKHWRVPGLRPRRGAASRDAGGGTTGSGTTGSGTTGSGTTGSGSTGSGTTGSGSAPDPAPVPAGRGRRS